MSITSIIRQNLCSSQKQKGQKGFMTYSTKQIAMYYQDSEISGGYLGVTVTWRDHVKLRTSEAYSSF